MNFAQPGWLALLLLLPILGIGAVLVSRLKRRQWSAFAAPRLRAALHKRSSPLPRWLALFFLLAATAATLCALARPRGDAGTRMEKTLGRNVMLALDISRSMRVNDVKPDRLAQAKVVIYELLEAMPNERIGLIGFAGSPYVYAPLTIDHTAVHDTVEQIDETWAPRGGSDLPAAVQLATDTLKKTGQKNNALVILSDGEEVHDDDQHRGALNAAIAAAEQAGVYVIAVGVGTEDGGYVPKADFPNEPMVDRKGHTIISRLQSTTLRKLADDTKGRFALAGSGLDIPALVKSVVKDLDAFEMDGRERKVTIEFYQWLMFPAILFLFVSIIAGTRWQGLRTTIFLAGAFLTISNIRAGEATIAKAALTAHRNEEARDAYHSLAGNSNLPETQARYRLGEATAAYRAGDFRSARSAYSQSLLSSDSQVRSNSHLGLGNSLFQLGWKGLSGDAYPADPATVPDLNRFDTIVKEALAKLRTAEAPDDGDTAGIVQFEAIITNWADAVRHYDSVLAQSPSDSTATKNRELIMTYLDRLAELLDEEQKDTEQAMPQAAPGDGKPQQGDGKAEPKEGEDGQQGPKKPGDKGEGKKDPKDGKGDQGDKPEDGKNGPKKTPKNPARDKDGENPNESPSDRAKRILKDNADLEKGPISRGRREFRDAEKDW